MTAPAQRITLTLTEAHVVSAVIGWLRSRGWRCERQQSGLFGDSGRKVRVGTPGIFDWNCFKGPRYFKLEVKRPGKDLSDLQKQYFNQAKREKLNVMWCDSFDSFIERFQAEAWSVER
jgi:hypothetical protein